MNHAADSIRFPALPRASWLVLAAILSGLLLALPGQANAKYASYIINGNTGEVLHAVNADTRNYPASLTKMMTLYLMFDALDKGQMRLHERIVFSRQAARQPASKLGLNAGQSLSAEDAIRSLAVKSANDVATAVAEHMSGSERKFALRMTAMARKLGMNRTTFRNASGLPHRAQMSTARDMALLARALIRDFPHYYGYFSEKTSRIAGRTFSSHNDLLTTYEGADGIKTGYIRASGFQLVTSVKRGKQRIIGVVLGGKTAKARNRHMTSLLNKAFAKLDDKAARTHTAQVRTIVPGRKPIAAAGSGASKVTGGKTRRVSTREMVWGVQVGAYRKRQPARDMASRAIELAPEQLATGEVNIAPLKKKNGRVLYRARILGLDKRTAFRACKALERQRVDCLELQAPRPIEMAMAN